MLAIRGCVIDCEEINYDYKKASKELKKRGKQRTNPSNTEFEGDAIQEAGAGSSLDASTGGNTAMSQVDINKGRIRWTSTGGLSNNTQDEDPPLLGVQKEELQECNVTDMCGVCGEKWQMKYH